MFNFQGPVRLSLAADDLIILPQKRFFVKHFFEKLLKFCELKSFSSFSVLTGTFERSLVLFKGFLLSFQKSFFYLSAWRSSIIPHPRALVNTFWHLFSIFFAEGLNSLSQSLTALPAPSVREPLAQPNTLRFSQKLCRHAKGPISEGAVAAGDWGSFSGSVSSPILLHYIGSVKPRQV